MLLVCCVPIVCRALHVLYTTCERSSTPSVWGWYRISHVCFGGKEVDCGCLLAALAAASCWHLAAATCGTSAAASGILQVVDSIGDLEDAL